MNVLQLQLDFLLAFSAFWFFTLPNVFFQAMFLKFVFIHKKSRLCTVLKWLKPWKNVIEVDVAKQ